MSFYATLSREAEVMVAELIGHAATSIDAPHGRKLAMLQTCDVIMRFCRVELHNMSVLSGVSHGRALISYVPISMALSNSLISYLHDSG